MAAVAAGVASLTAAAATAVLVEAVAYTVVPPFAMPQATVFAKIVATSVIELAPLVVKMSQGLTCMILLYEVRMQLSAP